MAPLQNLEQLADEIQGLAKTVSAFLGTTNGSIPNFDAAAPDVQAARQKLRDVSKAIYDITTGPRERLINLTTGSTVLSASLRWIYQFRIAQSVPLDAPITFTALATAAGVDESQLKRVLRYAITHGIFTEPTVGSVAHTSESKLLGNDPFMQNYIGHYSEHSFHIVSKMPEATAKWGASPETTETGFNVAFDTEMPMFKYMQNHPAKAKRFAGLMQGMASSPRYHLRHLVEGYDWAALGNGKVVDIGGSAGHASIALANAYPSLTFVVEDLPHVVAQGAEALPEPLKSRISFLPLDFFTPQPVKDADVYILRQICHDWSDKYAVKILENLLPAMKKGAKLVIMDGLIPPPNAIPKLDEAQVRMVDLVMMTHFNGKERDLEDWKGLFAQASPKLKLLNTKTPAGSVYSILELEMEE
ncbi:S-adenosyl-L-methionine-dependent methyltransferase [Eremomyces bilateralis CBS 781.70]|uniref:S-adenosyl-L-methionine-dependent methyltransferase n=1 Tax=Eremomyces bilateralis CBS 781.70 TaxID=1392243 RepID=A0A6G1G6F1_9PEZI|nr:S-adenosyl-L-methionine-dependent methyltransferase [Eremomyces bilateralis CBS 781.70]KAF1813460.1 S-adenosyl-L-methionine-dependent methyltransferase [Eremomyces bilateralis CBS 781.70]